jgi:hypothetical protein
MGHDSGSWRCSVIFHLDIAGEHHDYSVVKTQQISIPRFASTATSIDCIECCTVEIVEGFLTHKLLVLARNFSSVICKVIFLNRKSIASLKPARYLRLWDQRALAIKKRCPSNEVAWFCRVATAPPRKL